MYIVGIVPLRHSGNAFGPPAGRNLGNMSLRVLTADGVKKGPCQFEVEATSITVSRVNFFFFKCGNKLANKEKCHKK